MGEPVLRLEGVRKTFGSLLVSDHVTLEVGGSELFALIGPNGAGKTTLLAQIAGDIACDGGSIFFRDRAITTLSAATRARLGIARSFQVSTLFDDFSLEDNVLLALRGRTSLNLDLWSDAHAEGDLVLAAREYLAQVGLLGRANAMPRDISHGERRQLEVAMALAMKPSLLLLDEPMAGLGAEESRAMVSLLTNLKGTMGMLLVEHDMDAVEALADRVGVLVSGRIIATGTFGAIRADAQVRDAYLGADE